MESLDGMSDRDDMVLKFTREAVKIKSIMLEKFPEKREQIEFNFEYRITEINVRFGVE